MENQIYYIDKETLTQDVVENYIYPNMELNYYWSDDFRASFYIDLAYHGFITVSMKDNNKTILLPEIQFEYSVLNFDDLHISKKVKSLLKKDNYTFCIDENFIKCAELINMAHSDSWLDKKYIEMLIEVKEYCSDKIDFELFSSEVIDNESNEIIAAEIGYKIGQTYTSLTGYSKRDKKFNNYGKLQLVLLANFLKSKGFAFWNLGHPYMDYKFDLGAKVLKRDQFLELWKMYRDNNL